ncbi:MAG TPA: DNA polymerase III subunit delta [Candidatus Moranbacteria bacterium]|nr:DNA polymerase III subunit delta [Candidatus Moranbacteria bacterium]HAT74471.1 DNA polymerase III subunit delta [Candidatus Moranbacteria bacterium]
MIFFLYGEDSFRSYEKVLEIKKKFSINDKSGAGLSLFDAKEEKENILKKFQSDLKNTGLFSSKKLLILRRIISRSSADEQAQILKFFKENIEKIKIDTDCVIIFWEEESPRKNNALFKFLIANAKKQNFEKLQDAKLKQWILERIKNINPDAVISNSALEKLSAGANGDTATLHQEIEKLVNFSYPKMIDEQTVNLLTQTDWENNIFKTIEALADNKKQTALELLRRHIDKGDDPFYLFSMFVYQFRNLLRIASLQENGIFNELEIAKLAKLHPFVVKKSFHPAKNFGEKKLKNIFQKLSAIDTKIKTGKLDIKLALDKFVVEL